MKALRLLLLLMILTLPVQIQAADLKPALIETFGNEGGLQCSKTDPGNLRADGTWGCTKYGISARSYPDVDIRNITLDGAADIYERDFWRPLGLYAVNSQIVANSIFDAAVNQGQETLARRIQESINLIVDPDIRVDGVIGPQTIRMLNEVDQVEMYVNLIGLQYMRYHSIVTRNPKMKPWYRGWLYRTMKTVTKAVHDRDAK